MMPSFIAVSPYLIPLFGIAVAFVGYRKHDDARFAEALSAIAIAGCLVAALQHEMFNGYTMAFTAGLTGVTMFGYALLIRRSDTSMYQNKSLGCKVEATSATSLRK